RAWLIGRMVEEFSAAGLTKVDVEIWFEDFDATGVWTARLADFHLSQVEELRGKLNAVVILLWAKCSEAEWEGLPKELKDVMTTEMEELRRVRGAAINSSDDNHAKFVQADQELEAAEAEFSRLKLALEKIANGPYSWGANLKQIARAALNSAKGGGE